MQFVAAPWLLPPRTPHLPWAGVTELDALVEVRRTRAGTIAIVATTARSNFYAVSLQNCSEHAQRVGRVRTGGSPTSPWSTHTLPPPVYSSLAGVPTTLSPCGPRRTWARAAT